MTLIESIREIALANGWVERDAIFDNPDYIRFAKGDNRVWVYYGPLGIDEVVYYGKDRVEHNLATTRRAIKAFLEKK